MFTVSTELDVSTALLSKNAVQLLHFYDFLFLKMFVQLYSLHAEQIFGGS